MELREAQQLLKTNGTFSSLYKDTWQVIDGSGWIRISLRLGIEEILQIQSQRHTDLGAVVTAVLDDSLHLFMYELHTPQTGLL